MKAVPLVERLRSSQQTAAEIMDAFFSLRAPRIGIGSKEAKHKHAHLRFVVVFVLHSPLMQPSCHPRNPLFGPNMKSTPNWCSLLNRLILNVQPILERGIKQNHMSGGCMNPPR